MITFAGAIVLMFISTILCFPVQLIWLPFSFCFAYCCIEPVEDEAIYDENIRDFSLAPFWTFAFCQLVFLHPSDNIHSFYFEDSSNSTFAEKFKKAENFRKERKALAAETYFEHKLGYGGEAK